MTTEGKVRTVKNERAARYELWVDGELASLADYRRDDRKVVMHHTETRDQFRGRGLAAEVVRFALEDVREHDLKVVPSCWFVADFIEANPEYTDLVA